VDYVLAQAIGQYVDLGAGLPTFPAVHEVVRRVDNGASVMYVDNDPVVINHLHARTGTSDHKVGTLAADLAEPMKVLNQVQGSGLVDLDEPVCLILAMVLHFYDADTARDLVSAYVDELTPGSHVIISVARGQEAIGQQITRAYDAATVHNHSHDGVVSFFPGLQLISPGTRVPGCRAGPPRPRSMTGPGKCWPGWEPSRNQVTGDGPARG
jgi:O-methyltransferase involved in polyketide biosynthesis